MLAARRRRGSSGWGSAWRSGRARREVPARRRRRRAEGGARPRVRRPHAAQRDSQPHAADYVLLCSERKISNTGSSMVDRLQRRNGDPVDRNRWKGITHKKAVDQGIQSAKLPIGSYLKMSSSQVLTVNQVFEIMQKFVETKDWKTAFFHVIPPRKRGEAGAANDDDAPEGAANEDLDECLEEEANDDDGGDGDEEADVANKRHCIRSENGKS
ncbi:hypothetical protein ZWY2020_014148 [Hordeum vulgare]|nr:hypothetical protein ZWY2020_014148 [Hordeum vulgare]